MLITFFIIILKRIILIFRMSDVIRTYENTLYKVRSKKWGHPLGKAMSITGTVYRLGQFDAAQKHMPNHYPEQKF